MPRLLFIYNPYAGKGAIRSKVSDVVDTFVKAGYEVTIYPTQCAQDAKRKVAEKGALFERIVCSGGDGTLNEVVSGMMENEIRVPLGYIPLGSTNDFGNSLGVPKQPVEAAAAAVAEHHYLSDIGEFNGQYFVYVAAFGLFTDVSYQTSQEMKNMLGHSAYILEGMKRLNNVPVYEMQVRCDGQEFGGSYIYGMISNSRSVGGMKNLTGKEVELDDGFHEVVLIRHPENPIQVQEMLMAVLSGKLDAPNIEHLKASKVEIVSKENVPWTLDGEFGGEHREVTVINHKQAVDFLIA